MVKQQLIFILYSLSASVFKGESAGCCCRKRAWCVCARARVCTRVFGEMCWLLGVRARLTGDRVTARVHGFPGHWVDFTQGWYACALVCARAGGWSRRCLLSQPAVLECLEVRLRSRMRLRRSFFSFFSVVPVCCSHVRGVSGRVLSPHVCDARAATPAAAAVRLLLVLFNPMVFL